MRAKPARGGLATPSLCLSLLLPIPRAGDYEDWSRFGYRSYFRYIHGIRRMFGQDPCQMDQDVYWGLHVAGAEREVARSAERTWWDAYLGRNPDLTNPGT